MEIILNNRKEKYTTENITIQNIIEINNFTFPMLVTKINGKVVKKADRASTIVKDGDEIIVMHLVSGG